MQDLTMLSQKSLRWRRALSPRKASLPNEDWVLRGLTLHQLKDIITDIYASKAKADARSADQNQPRETMEQHLLAYLTNKYGVRQLITQWLTSILAAIEHFSPLDAQTALFGKVLRNEVEEEFEEAQLRVKTTASSLLQSILQARHPLMPDDSMAKLLRRHLKGTLPEGLWKEIVQGFCKPKDVTTVWARVQAAAVVYDSAEGRALSPSRARSPSPVRDGSMAAERLKNSNAADPAAVSFHVVVEILLRWNLELHEISLAPVVNTFRLIDDRKQGRLSRDQFFKFCNCINPAITDQEILSLLGTMAHCDSDVVTFSSCAHALVAELTKMMNHVHNSPASTI